MIISIVNGGPRANGATAKILKEIGDYLGKKGDVNVRYYDLARYNMKFCTGCTSCDATGKCAITDDGIEDIIKDIRNSDGIVIGCPTYVSNIAGQLKTFFDRAHIFIMDQTLLGKYGFSASTYETADGQKAVNTIDYFFLACGVFRKGRYLLKLKFGDDPFSRPESKKNIYRKIDRFYRAIKTKSRGSLYEYLFSKIFINLFLKPFYRKNTEKYGWILRLWKEKKIIC